MQKPTPLILRLKQARCSSVAGMQLPMGVSQARAGAALLRLWSSTDAISTGHHNKKRHTPPHTHSLIWAAFRPHFSRHALCTLYGFNSARRQHTATRPHRASAARDADHGRLPAAYSQRPLSCNLAQSQLSTRRERSPPASRAVRALVLLAMSLSSLSFWSCPCHPCLPCPFGHVLVILVFSEGKVVIF